MSTLIFNPPVIAHRGASFYAPENTFAAFTKAVQLGIKWIEFDVMQAACGEPIIFHDETLDRTTNGQGDVNTHPYAYLQTLDAGVWFHPIFSGERIPTLKQILPFIRETHIGANIEIKGLPGQEETLVPRILHEVRQFFSLSDPHILFSSFSLKELHCLRKHAPDCNIGLLLHEWEPHWQDHSNALQCVSIHVNHEIMTAQAAHMIKQMNKSLLCYTVNTPERATELYSWGVDAVFSDAPDKIASKIAA